MNSLRICLIISPIQATISVNTNWWIVRGVKWSSEWKTMTAKVNPIIIVEHTKSLNLFIGKQLAITACILMIATHKYIIVVDTSSIWKSDWLVKIMNKQLNTPIAWGNVVLKTVGKNFLRIGFVLGSSNVKKAG